jgi:hypothetical protein
MKHKQFNLCFWVLHISFFNSLLLSMLFDNEAFTREPFARLSLAFTQTRIKIILVQYNICRGFLLQGCLFQGSFSKASYYKASWYKASFCKEPFAMILSQGPFCKGPFARFFMSIVSPQSHTRLAL